MNGRKECNQHMKKSRLTHHLAYNPTIRIHLGRYYLGYGFQKFVLKSLFFFQKYHHLEAIPK
jgi:hypothetical protein